MNYQAAIIRSVPGRVAAAVLLMASTFSASAQSLSNLNQTPQGAVAIQGYQWLAQPFVTGSDSTGYDLVSVSLSLGVHPGRGGGDNVAMQQSITSPLYVSIYASSGNGVGTLVENGLLTGPLNLTTGIDSWTPTAGDPVVLAASTQYWLVTSTSDTNQTYGWDTGTGTQSTSNDGWAIPAGIDTSSNQGSTWVATGGAAALFSVDATDIPEPQTWQMLALVAVLAGFVKLARRTFAS